ncbi:hypothetical protein CBR_g36869, partial [Chara braunii]
ALDWVGGLHTSGCGAVVFLSDDNGGSWYCCGGVEKSETGRTNYDGRKLRTFFLTSVYDGEGKNWVKDDKKVSLDLPLFQGYVVKALSMKAFDVRENRTEFQMLDPEKFLSKTNGYHVTGSLPVLDNTFLLNRPLVQFNSPTDQLATVVMRYREQFARLPAAQQVDCVFLPIDAGSKCRQDLPAKAGAKRKLLAIAPLSSDAVARPLPASISPSDRQGRDAAEQSSEATDYDDGALRHLASPQHHSRGGTGAFDEEECEGQEGEGGGEEGDGGNEGDAEGEDNDMDAERDVGKYDACGVGDADDADGAGMSQWFNQAKDGTGKHGSWGKRKRGEALTSIASQTKQARTNAVNEARGELTSSQEARAPRKTGEGGRSGSRGGGHGGGRKGSQRARTQELRDSEDEGEGVGPRTPEDVDELVQRAAPLDTTRCFFLEYDEQGFARQDVHVVNVDVTRIKHIPRGRILYNHRSLSENIVRGIGNVIESSLTADPGAWDRPELVLAPVDPDDIVGGQGRRITPDEFFKRDSAEFDW